MPTMVCVDGFILTHAVERIDIPDQALVDAFLPPYEPMQSLDPADPISIGAMVGPDAFTEVRYLQYFKQHTALALIDKLAVEFEQRFGRQAGGLLRTYEAGDAETLVVAMGSINGTIKDVIDEMRADGVAIGLVTLVAFRPFPAEALREALARARDVVVIDRAVDVGMGGPLASNIAIALRDLPRPAGDAFGDRRPRRPAGAQGVAAPALPPGGGPALGGPAFPRPQRTGRRARAPPPRQDAARRPGGRGRPQAARKRARCETRGADAMNEVQKLKFYQKGTLTVGNRLIDERERNVQASLDRSNSLTSGHRACQGCGEALGARYAIDAAMRASQPQPHRRQRDRLPRSVHHALSRDLVADPVDAFAVRQRGGGGDRRRRGACGCSGATTRASSRKGGDGGTTDIGFGCLSGMFERNDDVLYICYDNEGYMNTGVQRSSATPPDRAHRDDAGAWARSPAMCSARASSSPKIAVAHEIPYVATASVADLHDLEAKVIKAMGFHGARYIQINVPCPLGWGAASQDTIKLARLAIETGLFPIFEAENGHVTHVRKIRRPTPVIEYLKLQRRFAHLFRDGEADPRVAQLQAIADRHIRDYGLLEAEAR